MRRIPILVLLFGILLKAQNTGTRIERVPDGTVEKGFYLNDALDISFQIQDGWMATLVPAGSLQFAPERPADDTVNRCSRAVFVSEPIHSANKPFGPKVTCFVIDPECFPGAPFPPSTKDRKAVTSFAGRAVHAFAGTPYISPKGADLDAFDSGNRTYVVLTADKNAALPGNGLKQADTVHVNTLLMITESNGYWVVIAEMVDDTSKQIMQASHFGVSVRR